MNALEEYRHPEMIEPTWAALLPSGKVLHYFVPHPAAPRYVHSPCGRVTSDKCIAVAATDEGKCKICAKWVGKNPDRVRGGWRERTDRHIVRLGV